MYGFRFVGSSKLITVTCTVRVCPDGYRGTECDLTTCGNGKRKRSTRLSETVTIQKATTSLTIRDPLMTSRAGRMGYELKTIIGLSLASVGFVKMKFLQG
ncbi:hypothetical protein KP79_PYT03501 [Mizuhopecten yessoensis]|uniref:ZP domain-containing protein n=1 Tax=Mizuhopecten yessoensis TaxID=6573 RepID=A0A210PDE9_MIZYE|nr:hypothetical protein KP79_PYT03501 [Mizuhopecten yessoensis]